MTDLDRQRLLAHMRHMMEIEYICNGCRHKRWSFRPDNPCKTCRFDALNWEPPDD